MNMSTEEILSVSKPSKGDYITLQDAQKELGVSRMTMYTWLNSLGIQRHTFPFDRRFYLARDDFERVKKFKAEKEV